MRFEKPHCVNETRDICVSEGRENTRPLVLVSFCYPSLFSFPLPSQLWQNVEQWIPIKDKALLRRYGIGALSRKSYFVSITLHNVGMLYSLPSGLDNTTIITRGLFPKRSLPSIPSNFYRASISPSIFEIEWYLKYATEETQKERNHNSVVKKYHTWERQLLRATTDRWQREMVWLTRCEEYKTVQ